MKHADAAGAIYPAWPSPRVPTDRRIGEMDRAGDGRAESEAIPWLQTAGMFADDPLLTPMVEEIYAGREAEREAEDAAG
jgi:hypothetical protein